ncbi:subtilisin-like protease SBT3 [Vicia villosa]|uniref:subtilisin-like protease SBT3 n=1 Tax=Vicia villosa TaxID=3911 RepID=UPI00273C3A35|nr:subtilisin-like protease SBT3 [Vicia villosa]
MEPHFNVSLPLMLLIITPFLLLSLHAKAETSSTYIIHMDKSLMPQVFTSHHNWYESTLDSTKSSKNLVYTYNHAMHGFSAVLSKEELNNLKKSHGFVTAYPDRTATIDTTHTFEFVSLDPSKGLWNASNLGENVIVGLIDSGIWPESESFRDNGMSKNIPTKWKGKCEIGQDFNTSMCNSKLIGARYFNKGVIASKPNVKISMNSARDSQGHGSHTSSTVAGNYVEDASFFGYAKGVARGIAPKARIAMYKVLWDEGRQASDVLAGMDQAIADNVDVISISLGFDNVPLYEDPVAIASFAAMEKNVVVSSSAGNEGPHLGTLHNGIPLVITVAAATIDRTFGSLKLGNGETIIGWTLFPATNAIVENLPLVYNKTLSSCNSISLLSQASRRGIIVCEALESVSVISQINNVTLAGVIGAVFISEDPILLETGRLFSPSIVINPKDKKALIHYIKSAEFPIASINFQQTFVGVKPAPAAAYYTSRGPSKSYPRILKPDVMAPGTNVLAAYVPNLSSASIGTNVFLSSNYNLLSGTSMSCPHVSGVAALLKAARPDWSPAAIRSAIVTTANPLDNTQNPISDNGNPSQYASPLAMGAGEIDPNKALDPGLIYDATPQDYVNLLCEFGYTHSQILTITRSKKYNCDNPSSDLNYPSFIALYGRKTRTMVQKFLRTVTNVGDGAASYSVKVRKPKGCDVSVLPEKMEFGYKNEKKSYSVVVKCRRKNKKEKDVTFGDIVWVEEGGFGRKVRSPIVVAPSDIV